MSEAFDDVSLILRVCRQQRASEPIVPPVSAGAQHEFEVGAAAARLRAKGFAWPDVADAILDRLLHQAHRLTLKGESLRRRHPQPKTPTDDPA